MKSRIPWGEDFRGTAARKFKSPINLPEVVLREDPKAEESEDPEDVVARAEARARQVKNKSGGKRSSKNIRSKSEYAESLHRQADILHHRLDYEAALVLYYRASQIYPRDPSHLVAVRRTSAAIISATNPIRSLKKSLSSTTNCVQLAANYCPETAALKAKKLLEESADPVSTIAQIFKYFDSRKDFWRDPSDFQDRRKNSHAPKSKKMLEQLSNVANATLKNVEKFFALDDFIACLKFARELVDISKSISDRYHYEVAARHYLAITQTMLGRHDRAVDEVSIMVRLAKKSGDAALRLRSLMTIGRVHLTFGHLDAAARAWEELVIDEEDAVPKAWLLHEIGRCYYEMKRYGLALRTARRCLEYADEVNSTKWQLYGNLLSGQALVELGRLGEAVQSLRVAADAALQEADAATHVYVTNLVCQLTDLLKQTVFQEENTQSKDQEINHKIGIGNSESEYKIECPKSLDRSAQLIRIESSEDNPRKPDGLTFRGVGDVDDNRFDSLTSRTRVIRRTIVSNDTDLSEHLAAREIDDNEERATNSDSVESNRTGITYVLDELRKTSIFEAKTLASGTSDNRNFESCHSVNEDSNKIADDRVRDKSKSTEYLRIERTGGLEIFL